MLDASDDPAEKFARQARALLHPEPLPERLLPVEVSPPVTTIGLDEAVGQRGMTVREVWHAALSQLALQLNQATFENYLKGAVVDSLCRRRPLGAPTEPHDGDPDGAVDPRD